MCPEMILNGSHNHTLDIWCLGILLYELLHGHAPFRGNSYNTISERILKGKIRFKQGLPDDTRNLILCLLQRDANDRIPLIQVFNHAWIKRMEIKYNLSKAPSIRESKEIPKHQESIDDKKIQNEDSTSSKKILESNYNSKQVNEQIEETKEHPKYKKKYKENSEEHKLQDSPAKLDKELRLIEEMETNKKKMMDQNSNNGKFANLLKKTPRKEEFKAYEDDLPQFGTQKKNGYGEEPAFGNKFQKLEEIKSKSPNIDERESSLPKVEDLDDSNSKKPTLKQNNFLGEMDLIDFKRKKPETTNVKSNKPSKPELSKNKSFLGLSDNEDEVLDNFKQNVTSTSFIMNSSYHKNPKVEGKAKNKDEIMFLIDKIDDELEKIGQDDHEPPVKKNKSFLLSHFDDEPLPEKKKKFEAGNKILLAIDDYTKLEKKAEEILLNEDNSKNDVFHEDEDSERYSRKKLVANQNQNSAPKIRETNDLIKIEHSDIDNSEPE